MKQKFLILIFFIIFILGYGIYNDLKLTGKDYFSVNFFNMKLGDGILIKTPQDKIILIDGGVGDQMISKISKKMGFFERKIDYIFLSHGDSDHITGLISIIKKFQVGKIFLTQQEKNTPYFKKFLEIMEDKKIYYKFYEDSENFFIEKNLLFKPIFPNFFETLEFGEKTNFSSVFELEIGDLSKGGKKFLFTGDTEKNIEKYLVKNKKISDVDYLKVGHHGSKTSSSTGFILDAKPKFGIICADLENRFGHPHQEIVDRLKNFGVKILQTGKVGDIDLKIY